MSISKEYLEWEDAMLKVETATRESGKHPGFILVNGRKPEPGRDYSRDGELSQDEHEYLTGTGAYSNDPAECGDWKREPEFNPEDTGLSDEDWIAFKAYHGIPG